MDRMKRPAPENRSESKILQILREQGESSVAELARLSGLGKATASRAIQSLRNKGLVEDTGENFRTQAAGRAGRAIRIRPESGLYLGMAIEPGKVTAVIADAAKRVIAWRREDVSTDAAQGAAPIGTVTRIAEAVLEDAQCNRNLLEGVGIAVAGPVDPRTGLIGAPVKVPEWSGRNLRAAFADLLDKPVVLENDANCSALAELLWGSLGGDTNAVLLRLDRGVGGAIIHRGEVLTGHSGLAGNYGHVPYDLDGMPCRCGGRGCFEHYLSIASVLDRFGCDTFDAVVSAVLQRDPSVQAPLEETADILAQLAAIVSRTNDPERILLGGELMRLGEPLLELANTGLSKLNDRPPRLELATAATLLDGEKMSDEPALGAIGLLIRNRQAQRL